MRPIGKIIAALALLGASPAWAQSVKISELPAAPSIAGPEKMPAAKSGTTVAITPDQLKTYINIDRQPLDPDLTAIAALATTTIGRDLLTSADVAAIRNKAGLGSIATQSASGVAITGGSIVGINDLALADGGTGASTAVNARTNLGLAIGSNVEAWDVDLDAIAALTGTNTIYYRSGAGIWSPLSIGSNITFSGGTLASTNSGGTVTSVSVVSANGVSGTVASATSTPALTISLGAITPNSINAAGAISAASASFSTALPISSGGTGATTASGARSSLAAAASGANSDITALSGLTTPLSIGQGGTGASSTATARSGLGAAASGANTDITSLSSVSLIRPSVTAGSATAGGAAIKLALGGAALLTTPEAGAIEADSSGRIYSTALDGLRRSISLEDAGTPTVTVLAGAGSGGSATIDASGSSGRVTITITSGGVAGDLFRVTYAHAYAVTSYPIVGAGDLASGTNQKPYATGNATGFTYGSNTLYSAGTYSFIYQAPGK